MDRNPIHLVLLHSNDIHGAFSPSEREGVKTGGLPLLSGCVRRIRREEKNVVYAVAGDMFMGSIIDREYKGLSTIRLMNALQPDVFAVGNHEVDYGLSHLLFLEKCADFPITCANMYVKELNRRLFLPYVDLVREGVRLRFVGLLTESVGEHLRQEELIDTSVSIRDVKKEFTRIFTRELKDRADLTILLSHVGLEEDKVLAAMAEPGAGPDMIIGGHSHTFLKEPLIVNHVPIVQAGFGSSQIGRFDLYFDPEDHSLRDWNWLLLPVNEFSGEPDPLIEFYQEVYQTETDRKYERILVTFPCEYTHPGFHRETQLIDLFTDVCQDAFHTDVFLISTNVIRAKKLGPQVTRKDLLMGYPYDNAVYRLTMKGSRLLQVIRHFLRKEAWEGASIYFLFSKTLYVELTKEEKIVRKAELYGKPIDPEREYTVGITGYAYKNLPAFLGISEDEIGGAVQADLLCENDREALEAYFSTHSRFTLEKEGRYRFVD